MGNIIDDVRKHDTDKSHKEVKQQVIKPISLQAECAPNFRLIDLKSPSSTTRRKRIRSRRRSSQSSASPTDSSSDTEPEMPLLRSSLSPEPQEKAKHLRARTHAPPRKKQKLAQFPSKFDQRLDNMIPCSPVSKQDPTCPASNWRYWERNELLTTRAAVVPIFDQLCRHHPDRALRADVIIWDGCASRPDPATEVSPRNEIIECAKEHGFGWLLTGIHGGTYDGMPIQFIDFYDRCKRESSKKCRLAAETDAGKCSACGADWTNKVRQLKYDYCITNPPFSRPPWYRKLYQHHQKPFAILNGGYAYKRWRYYEGDVLDLGIVPYKAPYGPTSSHWTVDYATTLRENITIARPTWRSKWICSRGNILESSYVRAGK